MNDDITVSGLTPLSPVSSGANQPTTSFKDYMDRLNNSEAVQSKGLSGLDLSGEKPLSIAPNSNTVIAKSQELHNKLDEISNQLRTKGFVDTRSDDHKQLIENHLSSANEQLAKAAGRPSVEPTAKDAVERFVSFATEGQKLLADTTKQAGELGKDPQLNAGKFLMLQAQLGQAQQQIEMTSNFLSQSISSFKTVMQVQL